MKSSSRYSRLRTHALSSYGPQHKCSLVIANPPLLGNEIALVLIRVAATEGFPTAALETKHQGPELVPAAAPLKQRSNHTPTRDTFRTARTHSKEITERDGRHINKHEAGYKTGYTVPDNHFLFVN